MPLGLFIAGTSTDVGKTHVAAMIARSLVADGHRVGVYKPAASGCRQVDGELVADDALALWTAAGEPLTLDAVCPQRFAAPLAPPQAAAAERRVVDETLLRRGVEPWLAASDVVLVEGAGGLMSPLGAATYNVQLAAEFGWPMVIVAANRLGVINDVLQTTITARTMAPGLPIAGIVLNEVEQSASDPSRAANAAEIAARCDAPLLATLGYGVERFAEQVNWYLLAAR